MRLTGDSIAYGSSIQIVHERRETNLHAPFPIVLLFCLQVAAQETIDLCCHSAASIIGNTQPHLFNLHVVYYHTICVTCLHDALLYDPALVFSVRYKLHELAQGTVTSV